MRVFGRVVLLVVVGGLLTGCEPAGPPPMPLSQLNAQQERGHVVFETRCARCHYDRRNGGLHGPTMLGVFKHPSLPSGAPANDERVTATVLHGHGLMPSQADSVDDQNMADLLAYLHTL